MPTTEQEAIIRHIKGEKFKAPILRPTTAQPRSLSTTPDPEREVFEERLVELTLAGKSANGAPRGGHASRAARPTRGPAAKVAPRT